MSNHEIVDILLVNAPSPNPGSVISHRLQGLPPLGLGYIGTYLKGKGFKVKIIDLYIDDVTIIDLGNAIIDNEPRIVAISTTTETFNTGLKVAQYCKEKRKDINVIMGGYHVTFQYEPALSNDYVDYVIRHEGEITMHELSEYLLKGIGNIEEIKGICYKSSSGGIVKNKMRPLIKNLDELPYPDRDLYDLSKYPIPGAISTSRGCPSSCIFCAATALSGGKYRLRSVGSILDEMKYLKSLGIKYIQIVDDTMTADLERLEDLLTQLESNDLKIQWSCESRVDIMNKELLLRMKNCGCVSIQFGVEAGSQEMLDCLKKNITITQVKQVFNWAKELNLKTSTCLMIAQPFDTIESINKTIDIGIELQDLGAKVVFSVTTPFPGTYIYNNPEKLGLTIVDSNFDNYNTFTPVYDTKNFTRKDIQTIYFDAIIKLGKSLVNETQKNELKEWREHVKRKAGVS